jgi:hypothetical protein
MCSSAADSHIVIAARYLSSRNHCPQCQSTPSCSPSFDTRVHMDSDLLSTTRLSTLLAQSLPVSLITRYPFPLSWTTLPILHCGCRRRVGGYIMYTAVPQATIYMCSQHGISLQLSCKPGYHSEIAKERYARGIEAIEIKDLLHGKVGKKNMFLQ